MKTIIFDGNLEAEKRRVALAAKISAGQNEGLFSPLKIAAIVFEEDSGGQLYTRKKAAAAAEVGMSYEPHFFTITAETDEVKRKIEGLNQDGAVTGIIIQKPMRRVYEQVKEKNELGRDFGNWWIDLTSSLIKEKDVDGLSPATLASIERGTWKEEDRVLPATVKAVLGILELVQASPEKGKMLIIGKSDLLGWPLRGEARRLGFEVELIGRKGLSEKMENESTLKDFKYVISATGQANLISGTQIAEGAVLVDVGEPQGDIDLQSVLGRAELITPVPGGVGPLTVVSLLENAYFLGALTRARMLKSH